MVRVNCVPCWAPEDAVILPCLCWLFLQVPGRMTSSLLFCTVPCTGLALMQPSSHPVVSLLGFMARAAAAKELSVQQHHWPRGQWGTMWSAVGNPQNLRTEDMGRGVIGGWGRREPESDGCALLHMKLRCCFSWMGFSASSSPALYHNVASIIWVYYFPSGSSEKCPLFLFGI